MDPGREIHDAVDEGYDIQKAVNSFSFLDLFYWTILVNLIGCLRYVDVDLGDLSHTIFSRSDEKNESRRSASSGGWVQNQSVKNLVPEKNDNDER